MTKLLDLIERVVPRMRLYPRWAQRLFTVSFAMTLLSFFLWAVIAPAADKAHLIKAVPLEIGVLQGSALGAPVRVERPNDTADRVGDRTESVLEDPISYDLDVQRRTVVAHVPYLELVRRGGPVGGVWDFHSWDSVATTYPKLDVKLFNANSTTVAILSATVHVGDSRADLEPVPVVFRGTPESPDSFVLQNEGWGRMTDVRLRYAVLPGEAPLPPSTPYPYSTAPGAVVDEGTIDVRSGVARSGLPARGRATVPGVLTYTWRDSAGKAHHGRVRIVTTVYLKKGSPGAGAPAPLQGLSSVALRMSGRNYDVAVPGFERFIPPSTPDRFALRLTTPRSSIHSGIVLELRYQNGSIERSQPVSVDIFQPRNSPIGG